MGKSTISMAIFNSKLLVYQRVSQYVPLIRGYNPLAYGSQLLQHLQTMSNLNFVA